MATIYDSNSNICGIVVKGYSNEKIETNDSALSGKWSKYINCNVFKKDDNIGYYLPLSFNEDNEYFTYSINGFSYNSIANNINAMDGNRCWFNYYNLMNWMNENDKWNSLWSEDQLNRGFNYVKSYQGVHQTDGAYITNADANQYYFIKPFIKHYEDYYDENYIYYNRGKRVNSSQDMYITTESTSLGSTDVTITTDDPCSFKLGYNGILSGYGLTKYIESVDTTNATGRPFWQRFFFVSIKGGFNAGTSYDVTQNKSNVKVCTFDQNTGLENESNSNLSSIPLKYKKLKTDVYLVQDDHFRTFQTYADGNDYKVRISLPMVMNTTEATIMLDYMYYIYGYNTDYVYTGSNVVSEYHSDNWSAQWTDKCYLWIYSNNTRFQGEYNYYNSATNNYTPYYDMGTKMNKDEISSLSSRFNCILVNSDGEYWVSGYTYSDTKYTENINEATIFESSAIANETRERIINNTPDIYIIDENKNRFFAIEDCRRNISTEFSSYEHANTIVNKMNEGGRHEYIGDHAHIYNQNYNYFTTKFATVTTNNYTTSSQNLVNIPSTKWLSLNYFFTPV